MPHHTGRSILLVQEVGLVLLAAYFVFIGGTPLGMASFGTRLYSQALVLVVFMIWLGWKVWHHKPWPRTPLDRSILVFLAAALLATVFSVDPRLSAEGFLQLCAYTLLYYFLVDQLRLTWATNLYVKVAVLGGSVAIIIGLFEMIAWYFGLATSFGFSQSWAELGGLSNPFPPVIHRITIPTSNPNVLAAYLALLIPLAFGSVLATRSGRLSLKAAIWLGLAVLALAFTFSRGGYLAILFAFISFPLLIRHQQRGSSVSSRPLPWVARNWWVLIIVIAIGGVGLSILGIGPFGQVLGDRSGSNAVRIRLWEHSIGVIRQHPILGSGPDTFGVLEMKNYGPGYGGEVFQQPHSLYLNLLTETGALGFLASSWLALSLVKLWLRSWPAMLKLGDRYLVAGAASGLVGFAVYGFTDSLLSLPAAMIGVVSLAAFLTVGLERAEPLAQPFPPPVWGPRLALAGTLAVVLPLSIMNLAQSAFEEGVQSGGRGDWARATAEFDRAVQLDPLMTPYRSQQALAYGQAYFVSKDSSQLAKSIADYQALLKDDLGYAPYHANLAVLLAEKSQLDQAIAEMTRAAALDPSNPSYNLNLAVYLDRKGDQEGATAIYKEALAQAWLPAHSPFWQETPTRRQAWLSTTIAEPPASLEPFARGMRDYQAGNTEEAIKDFLQAVKTGAPSSAALYLGISLADAGRYSEALTTLNSLASLGSVTPQVRDQLARVKIALGDPQGAERDLKMNLFLGADSDTYLYLGQLAEKEGQSELAMSQYERAIPAKSRSLTYEAHIFRRIGLGDNILPALLEVENLAQDTKAILALAGLYDRSGQAKQALRYYRRAIELDPSLNEVKERIGILSRTSG